MNTKRFERFMEFFVLMEGSWFTRREILEYWSGLTTYDVTQFLKHAVKYCLLVRSRCEDRAGRPFIYKLRDRDDVLYYQLVLPNCGGKNG